MKPSTICILFFCLYCSFSSTAQTITLNAAETLRINFNDAPPFDNTPDVLQLHLGYVDILSPCTSLSGTLYNGQTLLGTHVSDIFALYFRYNTGTLSLCPAVGWKSPASLFTYDNPAIIDFTSIQDGTINGRIDFRIQTGTMIINTNEIQIWTARADGGETSWSSLPMPVITSINVIPTPEPTTWLLLITGGMTLRKRNLNRASS